MGASSFSSCSHSFCILLLYILSLSLLTLSTSAQHTTLKDVSSRIPVLNFTPSSLNHPPASGIQFAACERIRVCGESRLKIGSYANSFRITLTPSVAIPESVHGKIEVCFHGNASLDLCQCAKDDWRAIQKWEWTSFMSPYEDRYLDVKFAEKTSGYLRVSVEEEFQQWRLYCLAFGLLLLLFAPRISDWVPFYYSSSMAIGVFLVVLIILFQAMKLLPTGRKSAFYFTIYGSVLGIGSYLVHYFSMLINSILENFGLSGEMHNPVSILLLVGIILSGAALGFWIVRKFVISEDGSVDVGISKFVKWAVRIIATTFIFQSTLDIPLAMVALVCCWRICSFANSGLEDSKPVYRSRRIIGGSLLRKTRQASAGHKHAEFLSRPAGKAVGSTFWSSPKKSFSWDDSPTKGLVLSSPNKRKEPQQDYYSTFHKTPTRKRFSRKAWEDFTTESTRIAMVDLASSPEFSDWIIDNADRIQLQPDDSSSESTESESVSSEETEVESGICRGFFKWY